MFVEITTRVLSAMMHKTCIHNLYIFYRDCVCVCVSIILWHPPPFYDMIYITIYIHIYKYDERIHDETFAC